MRFFRRVLSSLPWVGGPAVVSAVAAAVAALLAPAAIRIVLVFGQIGGKGKILQGSEVYVRYIFDLLPEMSSRPVAATFLRWRRKSRSVQPGRVAYPRGLSQQRVCRFACSASNVHCVVLVRGAPHRTQAVRLNW